MTSAIIYSALALLTIAAVTFLIRARRASTSDEATLDHDAGGDNGEGPDFGLAERIFDGTDYRWLRDEVGFPALAEKLRRCRTQMALAWLRAVRKSFDKLLRTPGPERAAWDQAPSLGSWELLHLTLRFHVIVLYALLVVRLFGPYHRLVPSFGWMPSLSRRSPTSKPYEPADTSPFA